MTCRMCGKDGPPFLDQACESCTADRLGAGWTAPTGRSSEAPADLREQVRRFMADAPARMEAAQSLRLGYQQAVDDCNPVLPDGSRSPTAAEVALARALATGPCTAALRRCRCQMCAPAEAWN